MKKSKRANIKFISIREYLFLFFALAAFNGFHMWIYQTLERNGIIMENTRFAINVLMLFVMATAAIVTAVIGLIRYVSFFRPIRKLSEAARNIAKGDFSVRLTPQRKGRKRDFFDVMFDDFNTMAEELASIETLKSDFIANVSHELKTPLSVIQFYSGALQNNNLPPEERAEYIKTIQEATQKLSALVANILKLNKLENQEIMGQAKPYDLSEQLRRCVLSFMDVLEKKNILFEEDLDETSVCYDSDMLEIVWNNLISNAIKFSDSGSAISISLKTQKDSAGKQNTKVTITDSGCGMDEATQKHIFDKFYQGDTSHAKEGNGLGLALVKRTIDLLGGTISVNSVPGKGSTFIVTI